MSPYQGLPFFAALLAVLLPAAILGLCGRSLRAYGIFANLLMLLLIFDGWRARVLVAAFCLLQLGLCFGYLALRRRHDQRWLLWLALALSLSPLVLIKLSALLPALRMLSFLGVSYMSFRAAQLLIEIYDGHIRELRPLELCYFIFFFPSVASGPLDRYRRFDGDLEKAPGKAAYAELLRRGVWQLATGAFYNFAVGNLIWQFWLVRLPADGFFATWSYLYGYTFYMFFNFAGYSRMAVGTAYLLGVRMPDNFRQPFLSVDMKDFWSRWHVSLSTWLRDYVYNRFCMAALRGKWFKESRTGSYLGYFITMTLMGLWHGLSWSFLVYGLYHGVLMSLNEVLDTRWKAFRKLKKKPAVRLALVLITFHLFGFGLLIFSGRLF